METAAPIARTTVALLAALLAALTLAASARADHPGEVSDRFVEKTVSDDVVERSDGLLRVPVQGPDLITHGPDVLLRESNGPEGFSAGDPERAPFCADSDAQQILYGRVVATADNYGSSVASIRTTVRQSNAVLNRDSLASGGPTADYRVRCDGAEIAVGSFTAVGFDFNSVVNGARAAGYDATDTDYTIFFDSPAGGACGIGSYYDDDRLIAGNANNSGGGYAVVYKGCWGNETMMHENGHNQGAVQYDAPYSTGSGGHCWDDFDVMCYAPDGGDKHQTGTISRCTDRTYFDCGFDTYFDSAPEAGEWLASHWNIGSPLNRFLEFGVGGSEGGSGSDGGSSGDSAVGLDPRDPTGLINGALDSALSAVTGGWSDHFIKVPRKRKVLKVTLRGASCSGAGCDLDLYLRHGRTPTLDRYGCAPQRAGARETCKIRKPRRGRWYIGVHSHEAGEGVPYEIRAVHKKQRRRGLR